MPQGYADRTVQRTSGGAATPAQVEALKHTPVGRQLDNPDATVWVDDRETPVRRKPPSTASPTFRLRPPPPEVLTKQELSDRRATEELRTLGDPIEYQDMVDLGRGTARATPTFRLRLPETEAITKPKPSPSPSPAKD